MKRCIDCKFYRYDPYKSHCIRLHTSKEVPNVIHGGTLTVDTTPLGDYRKAVEERESILPWKCGMKARYFQPKVAVPV